MFCHFLVLLLQMTAPDAPLLQPLQLGAKTVPTCSQKCNNSGREERKIPKQMSTRPCFTTYHTAKPSFY